MLAQVEETVAGTGTEDNALQTSTSEPSTVEFVAAAVASEATTVTTPEVPVMTWVLIKTVVGLVSAPSEMVPASTTIVHTIIERGSDSEQIELAPPMDIMEEFAHQMVQ